MPQPRPAASATPLQLILSIAICEFAGFIGSFFVRGPWYESLRKPPFNPPSWVFGPVWITLYALMGIALALVWNRRHAHPSSRLALALFFIQLLLNAAWTPVFFGLHALLPSAILIVLLWILILATILAFRPISPPAALFLIPYFLWTTFAAVLNISIVLLNRP